MAVDPACAGTGAIWRVGVWLVGDPSTVVVGASGVIFGYLGYLMLSAQSASNVAMVLAICFVIVAAFIAGEKLLINPLARRFRPPG